MKKKHSIALAIILLILIVVVYLLLAMEYNKISYKNSFENNMIIKNGGVLYKTKPYVQEYDFQYWAEAKQAFFLKDIKNSKEFYTKAINSSKGYEMDYLRTPVIVATVYGDYAFGKQFANILLNNNPDDKLALLVYLFNAIDNGLSAGNKDIDNAVQHLQKSNTKLDKSVLAVILAHQMLERDKTLSFEEVATNLTTLVKLPSLFDFEMAILAAKKQDKVLAKSYFKKAVSEGMPDMLVYYFKYLQASGDREEINTALKEYFPNATDKAKDRIRKVLAKNTESLQELLSLKTALSFIYGTFGVSTLDDMLDVKIIYLRYAYSLNPNLEFLPLSLATALRGYDSSEALNILYNIKSKLMVEDSALKMIAEIQLQNHKLNDSIITFKKLLALDNNNIESNFTLGLLYQNQKKYRQSINLISIAMSKTKDNKVLSTLYYNRAYSNLMLGKDDNVERDALKSIELNPNNVSSLNLLGYHWIEKGKNLDKALDMIKTALDKNPNDSSITDSYGWALFLMGRHEESLEYLEKAAEKAPYEPEVIDHLADNYWKLGRLAEAEYKWNYALTLNPSPELANKIKRKINNIFPKYLNKNQERVLLYPPVIK